MESVARHSVAHDLRQYGRAALHRDIQALKNQHASTFTDHETVAIPIERATGLFGFLIAGGKCTHSGKSTDPHGRDGGFRAATDHDVSSASLDQLEGIP